MQHSPSPYRSPSPYAPHLNESQYSGLPTGIAQVGPGAVTYTTSTGPDGRIIYQSYRAVAASYQTPNGVVSGIQWVPDPTAAPPSGSQLVYPTGSSEPSLWRGGVSYAGTYNDNVQASPEWDRSDEKRKKNQDKEAKWRNIDARNDPEYELRLARERDAQSSVHRDHRKSVSSGSPLPPGSVAFPVAGGTSTYPTSYPGLPNSTARYPVTPYSNHALPSQSAYPTGLPGQNINASGAYPDIGRQFRDMDLGSKEHAERDRKISGDFSSTRKYSAGDKTYERTRTTSGDYASRPNPYPSPPETYMPGPYKSGRANPYPASHYSSASPNMHGSDVSSFGTANSTGYPGPTYTSSSASVHNPMEHIMRSTTPFGGPSTQSYPSRSHNVEGLSMVDNNGSRSRPPSRAGSPNPAFSKVNSSSKVNASPRKSPNVTNTPIPGDSQQLPAPEAFFRPFNAANSFAPFDMMKIKDLDDIYDSKYPKMPIVLSTHDVYQEDWKRCMQDLGRCWTGQLPVAGVIKGGQPLKRSTLAKDLVHLWNTSFFFRRGVELILYKGKDRRTGPEAGRIEAQLPPHDDTDGSSSSPSSSSESELLGYENPEGRRRREEKLARRRRRKEKKARHRAKARDKVYTVYIACIPWQSPHVAYGTRPPIKQGGYAQPPITSQYGASAYSTPPAIPTTRSHGYSGGY
ncbi:hypothetical protein CPB84DRAFT_1846651 [Gymnopilus junonius]|uniref:Uncharacterized protein n=1 Tax=Gymnopilus junonius TaxID=109634 RepID=A0A9P5TPC9_GYMJU|nr:hypothetical protein CPB84DRAFT_1846651 [Gymnopilus junonius]